MNQGEKNVKKRKYNDEFLRYGFTSIVAAGIEKLKRHFDTKHPNFAGKDTQHFKNKADGVMKGRLDTGGQYHQQNLAAVETSYLVALRIARAKKPHTIAEDLLLPATKDIVRVMLGAEFVTKLNTISLSNDTVSK